MIFLTADTLMFNFLHILCCELTALVPIWICMCMQIVYKPIHVLHNAASKAPDILARCYGRFIAQCECFFFFCCFFHLAFDLEIFSRI